MAKAVINYRKLKRDIERATKVSAKEAVESFSKSERLQVGEAVIDEMKTIIEKGVSPIAREGRFPAYKWAGKKNAERKAKKAKGRGAKAALDAKYSNKYPYSQKRNFPSKRERPVNLYLSGDFLASLETWLSGTQIHIGFRDKLSIKKELGHREGANGQPKRPIIPNESEQFSPSIYRRLVKTLDEIVRRKFKK